MKLWTDIKSMCLYLMWNKEYNFHQWFVNFHFDLLHTVFISIISHFSGIYIINRCYLPCIYIKTPLTNTKWNIELVNRHKKHVFISNVNKVEWFIYKEVVCIVIVRRIINHYKFLFIINSYYSKLHKMHAFIKYSFQKKIVIQYFLF